MNIFGAVQGIASDDIGPANVEFDRTDLTLDFVDTASSPSVLITAHRFTLWWPDFDGPDTQGTAFRQIDISKVPEPSSMVQ